jgi:hypothetical protein
VFSTTEKIRRSNLDFPQLIALKHQSLILELLDVAWGVMVPAREATVGSPLRRQVFSLMG